SSRAFSASSRPQNWLMPKGGETKKSRKGRPHVATGGSTRGTTIAWGDYGLRMLDHDRRISAKQLKVAEDTIKQRLRGMKYQLYKRVSANIGVYVSGNEIRMGKGKGSFDHWAARVAVSRILFELKGDLHEQVVRDAFRLAGAKLPGNHGFVKKGDAPIVGITQLGNGVTLESLKRPRKQLPVEESTETIPPTATSTTPTSTASPPAP
ncbi:mitochondrial ribosomal protein L16, partial [Eremomyces bilateralis CBS 781.70]